MNRILFFSLLVFSPFCYSSDMILKQKNYEDMYEFFRGIDSDVLLKRGNMYMSNRKYDSALTCFSIVYNRYDLPNSREEKTLLIEASNKLGAVYYNFYNYKKALDFFIKGLNLCEEIGFDEYKTRLYNNIGNVYVAFGDSEQAKLFYEKSYSIAVKNKQWDIVGTILGNLIGATCDLQLYDDAKALIKEVNKLGLKKDYHSRHSNLTNMGTIYAEMPRYDSALYFFKRSAEIDSLQLLDSKLMCISLYNIANTYKSIEQYDSAVIYIQRGIHIAEAIEAFEILQNNYSLMAEVCEKRGDFKAALYYKNKYSSIYDSLFNLQEYGKIKDIQFLYDMEKTEQQITILNNEKKAQSLIIKIILSAFVVISILLIVLYIQKRKLSQTYIDLFNRNREIVSIENANKVQIPEQTHKSKYKVINEDLRKQLEVKIAEIFGDAAFIYNPDASLEGMVKITNSNTTYISQIINEKYDKNFNTILNELRIKEARRLLTDRNYSNYTIEAIAMKVGFKSKTTFNPIFKKFTGITPSQYQKIAKDKL